MKKASTDSRRSVLGAGFGALTLYGFTPFCSAQPPLSPSPGMQLPPIPKLITMDEKVAAVNHVFIGTGKRIYFIDRLYKEVPYDEAYDPTGGHSKSAILEISIDRPLYPSRRTGESAKVFVITSLITRGEQSSEYDALTTTYIGRPGIYFTQAYIGSILDLKKEGAPLVGTIPLHRLINARALSGPVENPLPLSQIHEVMRAVNKRIETEAKPKR